MKLFTCSNCQNLLYFENNVCLNCGHTVGFDGAKMAMKTLEAKKDGTGFIDIAEKSNGYHFCENAKHATCNWILPTSNTDAYCEACNLNRTIPDLSTAVNQDRWKKIEIAKHRLIYSLNKLGLPVQRKVGNEEEGIAFDFMGDDAVAHVMTGHDNGTITLNIDEADEVARTRHKAELGEKYRTLLGHFRHEIGHYYWDVLLKNNPTELQNCRKLFGDDTKDYEQALQTYYANGAPANWADAFISPYATSHPWEDWAETWAHYLHLMDTLETAHNFGIAINPKKANADLEMKAVISKDPYTLKDFEEIIKMWLPLTFAVNSLNRSMGHADFYPFFMSQPLIEKLAFIHRLCWQQRDNNNAGSANIEKKSLFAGLFK